VRQVSLEWAKDVLLGSLETGVSFSILESVSARRTNTTFHLGFQMFITYGMGPELALESLYYKRLLPSVRHTEFWRLIQPVGTFGEK
jgi:hypothetical protein